MLENQFIKKLQEKPEPVKHVIMWTATLFIMVSIFAFWVWNFSRELGQNAASPEEAPSSQAAGQSLPSVWGTFKTQADNFFDLFKTFNF